MYSEKKILKLLEKYGQVSESNVVLLTLRTICGDSMDYLEWAMHVYYECDVNLTVIELIMNWSKRHKDRIKYLSLGNIIRYRDANAVNTLANEISFLDTFVIVKKFISGFNTAQRGIMTASYLSKDSDGKYDSDRINSLGSMVCTFNGLDESRKSNFYCICSSFDNPEDIVRNLAYCTGKTYKWKREEMLEFMRACAPDCSIVYDKGNVVIIRVPSYESSVVMCGGGRTQWCITKADHYFDSYVASYHGKRQQFFLFDFNKFPTHKLANVGFTMTSGGEITNAHANNNDDIRNEYVTGENGEHIDIFDVLKSHGISNYGDFFVATFNDPFGWNIHDVLDFFKNLEGANIIECFNEEGKVLVRVERESFSKAAQGTFISNKFIGNNSFAYFLVDLNKPQNDGDSLIAIFVYLDKYDYFASMEACNRFDEPPTVVLDEEVFRGLQEVSPLRQVFHYIDNDMERKAMKIVEMNQEIDVMEMIDYDTAICFALEKGMYRLAYEMMKLDSFDSGTFGQLYGETFAEYLVYAYSYIEGSKGRGIPTKRLFLRKMMTKLLGLACFNVNEKDITSDTVLMAAAELPELNWFTKYLLMIDGIDVNASNSIGERALVIAARANNLEIVELLCQRPDITVSPTMKRKCTDMGVDLSQYLPKKTSKARRVKKSAESGAEAVATSNAE